MAVAICRVAPLSGSFGMVNEGLYQFNRVVAAHDTPILALTSALLLVIFVFANTPCHEKNVDADLFSKNREINHVGLRSVSRVIANGPRVTVPNKHVC